MIEASLAVWRVVVKNLSVLTCCLHWCLLSCQWLEYTNLPTFYLCPWCYLSLEPWKLHACWVCQVVLKPFIALTICCVFFLPSHFYFTLVIKVLSKCMSVYLVLILFTLPSKNKLNSAVHELRDCSEEPAVGKRFSDIMCLVDSKS